MPNNFNTIFGQMPPEALLKVLDKVTPKYRWGEYAHPVELIRLLRKTLGYDFAEWEPETVVRHVEMEFGDISEITENKIFALQTALLTDKPWGDFDVFENTCLSFSNKIPAWGVIEPLDLEEMAFGIGVLDAIRDEKYAYEVKGYIAAVLIHNGIICQPKDSVLPNVKDILYGFLDKEQKQLAKVYENSWDSGVRSVSDNTNPLDVQMYKIQAVEDWYNIGKEF